MERQDKTKEQLADELRRSERRFRSLAEGAPDYIVQVDRDGKILFINRIYEGLNQDSVLGTSILDWLPPLFRSDFGRALAGVCASGVSKIIEYHARDSVGRGLWYSAHIGALRGEGLDDTAVVVIRDITEGKRAEEEIREARDRYLAVTNLTGDIIVHLDEEGKWIFLNDGACAFWGEPREALLGKAFTDYVHPDDLERTLAVIDENKDKGVVRSFVNRQRTLRGWRTVEWNGAWFRNQDSELQVLQATGRDVTIREQMEEALRESENRFRELFDRMSSGVAVYQAVDGGEDFVLVDFNRGAEEIEGLSKERVIGRRVTTVFPCAREAGLLEVLRRVWRTGEPEHQPVTRYRGLGRERWRRNFVYRLASGEVVAVYDDVTGQKRAEEALRESEERYRSLVETAHDIIFSCDENGTITYVNEKGQGVLGYREEEKLGRAVVGFVPPEDADKIRYVVESVLRGEEQVSYEQRVLAKDGRVVLMDFNAAPLRDGNGKVIGAVATARDITDRNRMEEEAERHRQDLARTDKLTSLGTLVSGVAHEINNPNHFIMLNAPILRDTWRDLEPVLEQVARQNPDLRLANLSYAQIREEVPQLIDDIIRGSDRIKHVTSELRDYSREQNPHTTQPVAVNDVVKSALTLLATPIRKATSSFSVDYGDDLPRIRGNHRSLEQVIINLLLNACQSLPDRSKAVRVATRQDKKAGRVVVSVEDQGCGIPAVNLERIRHPFFTTRPEQGGTGLGLAVAARIVDEHKGELVFESAVGEGTTVRLLLPAVVEHDS